MEKLYPSGIRKVVSHQHCPLTHEERRRVIEAPWPSTTVWCGKSHGGVHDPNSPWAVSFWKTTQVNPDCGPDIYSKE